MTGRMKDLIYQYFKDGHRLAKCIHENEVGRLVQKLRLRLPKSESDINFSPESLNSFYSVLLIYCQQAKNNDHRFSDEENLWIVREITAYIGRVFLDSLNGKWESHGSLLNNCVAIEGYSEAIKGNKITKAPSRSFNIGYFAASVWDAALIGMDIDIFQSYKEFSRKRLKERLRP